MRSGDERRGPRAEGRATSGERRGSSADVEVGTALRAVRCERGASAFAFDGQFAVAGRTPAERRPYLGEARRSPHQSRLTGDRSPYLGKDGFTLLEVLLAFALFAVAVVVLASSYLNIITSLEAVKSDRAFDQEVRWVREQVLQESDLKEIEKGGELTTPESGVVRWQAKVFPAVVADLFTVELRVELVGEKKGQQDLREHTERLTVLRPSWSDPVERGKLYEDAKQRIEEDRRQRGILPGREGKEGKRT